MSSPRTLAPSRTPCVFAGGAIPASSGPLPLGPKPHVRGDTWYELREPFPWQTPMFGGGSPPSPGGCTMMLQNWLAHSLELLQSTPSPLSDAHVPTPVPPVRSQ